MHLKEETTPTIKHLDNNVLKIDDRSVVIDHVVSVGEIEKYLNPLHYLRDAHREDLQIPPTSNTVYRFEIECREYKEVFVSSSADSLRMMQAAIGKAVRKYYNMDV